MTLDQIKNNIAAWAARRKWEAEWRKQNAGRRIAGMAGRRQLLTPLLVYSGEAFNFAKPKVAQCGLIFAQITMQALLFIVYLALAIGVVLLIGEAIKAIFNGR